MRGGFARRVLSQLLREGVLSRSDAIVAVCAGPAEERLFTELGFGNVTLTSLRPTPDPSTTFRWLRQDAEQLELATGSADFSFISDGLHHCRSPHRGLLEAYRVARKGIVVIESKDSLPVRAAEKLGLGARFEVEAVARHGCVRGGVDDSEIPNHVYRWTERELTKTLASFDPSGPQRVRFFYELSLPYERLALRRSRWRSVFVRLSSPAAKLLARLFPRQCNTLAMVALKPRVPEDLWPWLESGAAGLRFDRRYAARRFGTEGGSETRDREASPGTIGDEPPRTSSGTKE